MVGGWEFGQERLYTDMTIQKRSAILGIIVALILILYGAAKFNSFYLVEYVVEKTLIQKAPSGTDPAEIHKRLQGLLAAAPDRNAEFEMLFRISEQLEKVQELSPRALEEVLEAESRGIFLR
jgi:hypothetical protein